MKRTGFVIVRYLISGIIFSWHSYFVAAGQEKMSSFLRVDNSSISLYPAEVTEAWHECSIDPKCNFLVKQQEKSKAEKRESIIAVTDYFAVWKKIPFTSYRSCKNAYSSGIKESGTIQLLLHTLPSMSTFCDMTTKGGGWTIIQRRVDNDFDFHRNWNDYKTGFGTALGNFWLGLEAIYQLTKDGVVTLRVDLKRDDGKSGYAEYRGFKIGDESSKYRLTLGNFSDNGVGNAMADNDGMKFSTKDQDNDVVSFSCAQDWEGGWWYHSCFRANLNNGFYSSVKGHPDLEMPKRMSWKTWSGNFGDITFSEMKLKTVD